MFCNNKHYQVILIMQDCIYIYCLANVDVINMIVLKGMSSFCTLSPGDTFLCLPQRRELINCILFLYQARWSQWLAVVKPWAAGVIRKLWPCSQQRRMGTCAMPSYVCLPAHAQLPLTHIFIFCVSSHPSTLWRTTVEVPRGGETKYRYFKGFILESKVRFSFPSKQTW